ncbi:MAG: hypothetical protein UR12_C0014G0004 [candidate division TM6 bacterium GW2011_GWF2_30_66]|jgi:ankyrin repeat protein|nr:MAG: hypothetical protein UR12_C0014G0004 [candidate division TM6 bacterium GW2011_GWF2_30_66]
MSARSLFISWLALKAAIFGLLFILLSFNYIFSTNTFWYDVNFDSSRASKAIAGIGSNIDKFDQYGYTALMIAAQNGETSSVDLMIKNGANVNLTANNDIGDSALHTALWNMSPKVIGTIDLLLKNNSNPLLKNKQKRTPLIMTVRANAPEDFKKVLDMFIAKGVDINYPDDTGRSLLFSVVDQTKHDILNALQTDYKHLIDFDLKDKSGKTVTQLAATKGDIQDSLKPLVFKQLGPSMSVNSYDPRYSFNKDFTLIMVAAIKGKDDYLSEAIKKYGGDVNLSDKIFGNTSLHWACLYNRLKCVGVILENNIDFSNKNKADINLKNKAGMSPIHCLWGIRSSADRISAAKLLYDAGANFNAQDNNGNTFLHNAVLWADVDFVKLIATDDYFVHRVNFNIKNKDNKTAFDLAQKFIQDYKYLEISNLLRNYNNIYYVGTKDKQVGITALMLACIRGDQATAKTLIAEVKDAINKKDKNGDTPLHFALRSRNIDIAKMLIAAGAKVNEKNNLGDTPLNEVINIFDKAQREEIVKLLLEKGSGISENKNGENIMHLAVRKNMPELILFLKQNFGKSAKNKDGKTAYDLAKEIGKKSDAMKEVINALDGIAPVASTKR